MINIMYKEIKKKTSPSHQEILQFYQCFHGSKDAFIVNYMYLL